MGQTIYLIDHENVDDYGLKGIEKLKGCKVVIYYSNVKKIGVLKWMLSAYSKENEISYDKLMTPGKNALDFMIVSRLGFESRVR